MNYNERPLITVNIVDFKTNLVLGRFPCNDYEIDTEYLSTNASTFTLTDLSDNTITNSKRKVPLKTRRTDTYDDGITINDYVYVTKNDGSDVVPRRASAFYVGIITNIDGYTITTKSILTLLDIDSVVGLKGMFPAYSWTQFPGYSSSDRRPWTNYGAYSIYDCDTILSLIQSIEYALGQTPKLESWPAGTFGFAQFEKKFQVSQNGFKIVDVNWGASVGAPRGSSSYVRPYQYEYNARNYDSAWWASMEKQDILIDCPLRLMSMGRGDPKYFFDLLSYGTWCAQVSQWGSSDSYVISNTIRKSMRPEDFPACYCGLGNHASPMTIENLWSRLKKWYEEKHIMVIPVIYDSAERNASPFNNFLTFNGNIITDSAILVSEKGARLSSEKALASMSNYDLYNKYNLDDFNYPLNTYWMTEKKSTSSAGKGYLWGSTNRMSIANLNSDGTIKQRQQNNFYDDNVFANTGNGRRTLHMSGTYASSPPVQYANIGLKIVHIDSDPGYRYSGEIYRFNQPVIGGSVDRKYELGLFNLVPADPAVRKIGRDSSLITGNICLPRAGKNPNYEGSAYETYGNPYSQFYTYYTTWYRLPTTEDMDVLGDLMYVDKVLYPVNELSWFLDIDENDPNVEFTIQNGTGRVRYDVMLYKSTIGAISQKYENDDEEWSFYTYFDGINRSNYDLINKPYPSAMSIDDEYPVAQMVHSSSADNNEGMGVTILRGGFDPINGITNGSGGSTWDGSLDSRRKSQHKPVTAPVLPLIDSLSNLKSVGADATALQQYMRQKLPTTDSQINFDIKISNSVDSSKINKWQIRTGQVVFLHLKDGRTYTNLRVLGVNINKDDDFFTVSVGAKSPTLINEIERRTR